MVADRPTLRVVGAWSTVGDVASDGGGGAVPVGDVFPKTGCRDIKVSHETLSQCDLRSVPVGKHWTD